MDGCAFVIEVIESAYRRGRWERILPCPALLERDSTAKAKSCLGCEDFGLRLAVNLLCVLPCGRGVFLLALDDELFDLEISLCVSAGFDLNFVRQIEAA